MIDFFKIFSIQTPLIFIAICFILILVNFFLVVNSRFSITNNFEKKYFAEQRVHEGEVSRLGGTALFIWFFFILLFYQNYSNVSEEITYYIELMVIITPLMFISFFEDYFNNVSIRLRSSVMIITVIYICTNWIFIYPEFNNIPILSYFSEYKYFSVIFFSLILLSLMNGANFIDGMNGLLGLYLLGVIFSCMTLFFATGNSSYPFVLVILFIGLISFLIFNFPFGSLFIGDSGAYFVSLILGLWVIDFFAKNTYISSWNAIIIFFYPLAEVTYSVLRKTAQKKSPFYPDRLHLHIKIYDIIHCKIKNSKVANGVTTIFLAFFWLVPPLVLPLIMFSQFAIFLSLLIFSIIYISLNILIQVRE